MHDVEDIDEGLHVVDDRGLAKQANLLKELMTRAANSKKFTSSIGTYVPPGLASEIGAVAFHNLIRSANVYLSEHASIPVRGLSLEALSLVISFGPEKTPTPIAAVFSKSIPGLCEIEPTQTQDKFLFVVKKATIGEAQQWLDLNLEQLFTQCLPAGTMLPAIDGYPYPT